MDEGLIYDAGMHRGEDAEFYLKKGFRVVGIEALATNCDLARERLRGYVEGGKLVILNLAIAEITGPVRFFVNRSSSVWGTTSARWAKRNQQMGTESFETTVEGIEFARVLSQYGVPYYLKVDIEGADMLCLDALRAIEDRPKYISIESAKTSWAELRSEFEMLKSLGYSKFKVVHQSTVPRQVCRFPPREGAFTDHRFESGSSGLFGDEIPGEWLSEQAALGLYRRIFLKYRFFGDSLRRFRVTRAILDRLIDVGWYDTHAAR